MPNGERDFLTARQLELLEKAGHYDALIMLDNKAAQVERVSRLIASHYQNQFHVEIAQQAITEFEKVEYTIKFGTVVLICTVLSLGASSMILAAGTGQTFRTGAFYVMAGEAAVTATGAPVTLLAGELTIASKITWGMAFGGCTMGMGSCMQALFMNDTLLGLLCKQLGKENITPQSAAQQWVGLAIMAHIRSLSPPLNYLLGMNESEIGEARQKTEEHIERELQKHFAGNASATPEAIRRMRDIVQIEFWADRANEATQFRIDVSQKIGRLRKEINSLKSEIERAVASVAESMTQPSYR